MNNECTLTKCGFDFDKCVGEKCYHHKKHVPLQVRKEQAKIEMEQNYKQLMHVYDIYETVAPICIIVMIVGVMVSVFGIVITLNM